MKYENFQTGKLFLKIDFRFRTCDAGPNAIVKEQIKQFVDGSTFNDESNLDVAHLLERKCAEGYYQRSVKYECNNFDLKKNDKNEYDLWYNQNRYPPDSFCLGSQENETDLIARLCLRKPRKDRFE